MLIPCHQKHVDTNTVPTKTKFWDCYDFNTKVLLTTIEQVWPMVQKSLTSLVRYPWWMVVAVLFCLGLHYKIIHVQCTCISYQRFFESLRYLLVIFRFPWNPLHVSLRDFSAMLTCTCIRTFTSSFVSLGICNAYHRRDSLAVGRCPKWKVNEGVA